MAGEIRLPGFSKRGANGRRIRSCRCRRAYAIGVFANETTVPTTKAAATADMIQPGRTTATRSRPTRAGCRTRCCQRGEGRSAAAPLRTSAGSGRSGSRWSALPSRRRGSKLLDLIEFLDEYDQLPAAAPRGTTSVPNRNLAVQVVSHLTVAHDCAVYQGLHVVIENLGSH